MLNFCQNMPWRHAFQHTNPSKTDTLHGQHLRGDVQTRRHSAEVGGHGSGVKQSNLSTSGVSKSGLWQGGEDKWSGGREGVKVGDGERSLTYGESVKIGPPVVFWWRERGRQRWRGGGRERSTRVREPRMNRMHLPIPLPHKHGVTDEQNILNWIKERRKHTYTDMSNTQHSTNKANKQDPSSHTVYSSAWTVSYYGMDYGWLWSHGEALLWD